MYKVTLSVGYGTPFLLTDIQEITQKYNDTLLENMRGGADFVFAPLENQNYLILESATIEVIVRSNQHTACPHLSVIFSNS